ncbi:MAG: hypothetical protein H6856_08435 [Rhodospirillales bacterium]|nr:hypothetical protein [Rhodospirillales bacterium]
MTRIVIAIIVRAPLGNEPGGRKGLFEMKRFLNIRTMNAGMLPIERPERAFDQLCLKESSRPKR